MFNKYDIKKQSIKQPLQSCSVIFQWIRWSIENNATCHHSGSLNKPH